MPDNTDSAVILGRAIQKAIEGGWHLPDWCQGSKHYVGYLLSQGYTFEIIFNHDFAKALWGEFANDGSREDWWLACVGYEDPEQGPYWKWQLQQMVIANDPIKYLGEHLND